MAGVGLVKAVVLRALVVGAAVKAVLSRGRLDADDISIAKEVSTPIVFCSMILTDRVVLQLILFSLGNYLL